jgi:predicted dehydrogenase
MTPIAFVGCAHIHTPDFVKRCKARRDVQVKTVWDHDAARAKKNADELGCTVTDDLKNIWKDPDIKAVVVCSETDRHKALVLPAAKAGKHLFVEKPLGIGAKDAYAMADAIEKAGVLFQTGYFMRGLPVHQFLKEQIDKGLFGKITRVRHSTAHQGALGRWFDTDWRWMADPKRAGVGAFGDLGTHSLDILLYLVGDVESCTATLEYGAHTYPDCDETGEALIKFKNDVIGTLAAGWADLANPVKCLISGTEAHAAVIDDQLFLTTKKLDGADGKTPWTQLPPEWPHAFELFLDAVVGKPNVPLVGAREAAYRSAVMEAMYKAAKTGKWVGPRDYAPTLPVREAAPQNP